LTEFYGPHILQDVGYDVRARGKRSRKRGRRQDDKSVDLSSDNDGNKPEDREWQQLKQFLDPNPQLKGTSHEDNYPKVCYHYTLCYVQYHDL